MTPVRKRISLRLIRLCRRCNQLLITRLTLDRFDEASGGSLDTRDFPPRDSREHSEMSATREHQSKQPRSNNVIHMSQSQNTRASICSAVIVPRDAQFSPSRSGIFVVLFHFNSLCATARSRGKRADKLSNIVRAAVAAPQSDLAGCIMTCAIKREECSLS